MGVGHRARLLSEQDGDGPWMWCPDYNQVRDFVVVARDVLPDMTDDAVAAACTRAAVVATVCCEMCRVPMCATCLRLSWMRTCIACHNWLYALIRVGGIDVYRRT